MGLLPINSFFLSFLHAAIAALALLSFINLLIQKISNKKYFAWIFFSICLISFYAFTRYKGGQLFGDEKKFLIIALLTFSFAIFSLFYKFIRLEKRFLSPVYIIFLLVYMFTAFLSMKTYILPLLAIVFYAPFLLIFMLELSSKKVLDVSKLPYKEMLFILGLIYPLGFFINITPSYGAFRLFSFFLSAGMMLFLYFSIFEQNSISTRQFIKYFFSLVPVYIICVYFSYYYSSYYSSVIGKTHFQREMFLIWTHLSFISVILAYLFYGVFSRYLANIFMKGYNSKDQKLREFALKMNPLQGFQNIFISFANNFESLMGFKIKASVFLHNDQVYVLSDGITREIKEDMQELKDAISQKVILPSEFFFRSTFHLLKLLKEYGIVQDFGYILPIHVKGEFDGFFITDPPPLSKKMVIARILPFMKYFKATVEKVMINADQLIHEKDIQDKILALEVKKRTSDEIKKKNTELQQALEKLKNKQKQLIDAEKWASICQVTVSLNHEINNPLTHIMGSSQMLKMQLQKGVSIKDKDLYDYLGKVEKQCQRIKTIIENLRKVSEPVAVDYLANTKMLNLRI